MPLNSYAKVSRLKPQAAKHAGLDRGIVRSEPGGFFEVSRLENRHASIGQLARQTARLLHERPAQNDLSLVVEPADVLDVFGDSGCSLYVVASTHFGPGL